MEATARNKFQQQLAEQERRWRERQQDKHLRNVYGSQYDILSWNRTADDESGKVIYENPETGEVKEFYKTEVEVGSKIITPERCAQNKKAKNDREVKKLTRGSKGADKFVFANASNTFEGISPAMVTRLVYLSAFAGYIPKDWSKDKQALGNPIVRRGEHLKKKDIAGVLKLSEGTAVNFLKEVCPTYIKEDSDGFLYLNSQFFYRGGLRKNQYTRYQQIYFNGVRKLYDTLTNNRKSGAYSCKYHKQLGYVFMMLPYINIEHNTLCFNPHETDATKIVPMSPAQFCEAVGYTHSNLSKLMNVYKSIMFEVNGRKEHFCKIICDWNDQSNGKIYINPAVIYAGSAENRVETSRIFFTEQPQTPETPPKVQ